MDATLNKTCRMITGCLKPTNTRPRRNCSTGERWQVERNGHGKNGSKAPTQRTSSSGATPEIAVSFIKCTEPINATAKSARMELWRGRFELLNAIVHLNISADEHLPAGAESPCTKWKALNRLRTQIGWLGVNMLKWEFPNASETCDCGTRQTMQHLLVCSMMSTACSTQDLTMMKDMHRH